MNSAVRESDVWQRMVKSAVVREQQVAFTCATGVPLALVPASAAASSHLDGAFCVKGCLGDPSGTVCGRKLLRAEKRAVMNLLHASETPEEAKHEIEHWFGKGFRSYPYKRFGVDE